MKDMVVKNSWVHRYPLLAYALLAYGFSWVIQITLALQAQGITSTRIPYSVHYLTGYGPLLAALIVTSLISGRQGLSELIGRLTKWRLASRWWLVAVSPLIALVAVSIATQFFGGEGINLSRLGQIDHFPAIGIGSLFLWLFTFGLGEEAGWRGFALPRLQDGRSALSATFILWGLWSFWHLPLFFYMYTPAILPGLLFGLLAGSIVFTWIYNSTEGSVLMTIIWHGTFNYATACSACKTGSTAVIISTLVMVWAVLVVLIFKPATLSRETKSVLEK